MALHNRILIGLLAGAAVGVAVNLLVGPTPPFAWLLSNVTESHTYVVVVVGGLLMSVVTAIGTAGVPGGSIPLLMMVLQMVGVPVVGIAIVIGVDRILDMSRTGDMVTAAVVDRFERTRFARAESAWR